MDIRLTQFSHGAGCGCKIAPAVLEKILHTTEADTKFPQLIVGHESRDDAAVFALSDEEYLISTTDFFMPIVDDAETFGAIASANALSDVYAMGGTPLLALAILGWPVDKIPPEVARQVLAGARAVCAQANIPLAGGHSIDSSEPIFGLAVTGRVQRQHLKKNNTARPGDHLFLSKPLGTGIVTTAQKRGLASEADLAEAVQSMKQLNTLGTVLGTRPEVNALTDVTGFGLLGHLLEICEGSRVGAEVDYARVPLLSNLRSYTSKMIYPDNAMRNWQSFENRVEGIGAESLLTLCDPQTSGGLLACVDAGAAAGFEEAVRAKGYPIWPIGQLTDKPARVQVV